MGGCSISRKLEHTQEPSVQGFGHGIEDSYEVEPAPVVFPELFPQIDVKRLGYEEECPTSLQHPSGTEVLDDLLESRPSNSRIYLSNQFGDIHRLVTYRGFIAESAEQG